MTEKRSSEKFTTTFLTTALVILLAVVVYAVWPKNASGTSDGVPLANDPSGSARPTLSFQLLGEIAKFDDSMLVGKPVVVNFWASWCPPCNEEAPTLAAAYEKWHSQGVEFVGVDSSDSTAGGLGFIQQYDWRYPVVEDPDGEVQTLWGLTGLPATFFIDRHGVVVGKFNGAIDAETLDSYIALITQ